MLLRENLAGERIQDHNNALFTFHMHVNYPAVAHWTWAASSSQVERRKEKERALC